MSSKIGTWFKNLSYVAKVSVISAVALSGIFVASAITSTPPTTTPPVQVEVKKEPVVTTKIDTETQPIPFEKQIVESSSFSKGTTQIQITGVDGVKTITHTITLADGIETNRTSSEAVTTAPITEVTANGTYVKPVSNCDVNYSGCVPIVSYDLDCADIGYTVRVLGYDKHGLDRDSDGYGCESY